MHDAYCIANYGTDRYGNSNPVYMINYGGGQSALYTYLAAILIKVFGYSLTVIRIPALVFSIIYLIFAFLENFNSLVFFINSLVIKGI